VRERREERGGREKTDLLSPLSSLDVVTIASYT
jgi:hypothetical protein